MLILCVLNLDNILYAGSMLWHLNVIKMNKLCLSSYGKSYCLSIGMDTKLYTTILVCAGSVYGKHQQVYLMHAQTGHSCSCAVLQEKIRGMLWLWLCEWRLIYIHNCISIKTRQIPGNSAQLDFYFMDPCNSFLCSKR